MVDLFQMGSSLIGISVNLIISLFIMTITAQNMIDKKRTRVFIPFFIIGIGLCLSSGFMFYNFFGVAVDVFFTFVFVSVIGMFLIIKENKK